MGIHVSTSIGGASAMDPSRYHPSASRASGGLWKETPCSKSGKLPENLPVPNGPMVLVWIKFRKICGPLGPWI